jgi:sodium-dependent dicarboxylate transporter 2/3/5
MRTNSKFILLLGIGLFLTAFIGHATNLTDEKFSMVCVALIIATFWIFEVMPLAVTALIPLVAYPLLGIMSTKQIAPTYMSSVLMIFIGGFFIALAMRRWNLHKRIALTIVSFFGNSPSNVITGFMVATALLSMWISNTATCVMMVSIGLAVIKSYEDIYGETQKSYLFSTALMLAIAYAATIGGVATIVGTPPNLAFMRIFAINFPDMPEVSFGQWFSFGLPLVFFLLLGARQIILFILIRNKGMKRVDDSVIEEEKQKLGPIKYEEKVVFVTFTILALLWIFRKDLNLGFFTIPGWSHLFKEPNLIDDGTVAISMAFLLFLIPTKSDTHKKRILEKGAISEIPWHTILLFGGGFALAEGIQHSGLSQAIGQQLSTLRNVSPSLIIISLTAGMSFLTELASNMASTEMALPILASLSKAIGINPYTLMIPATLAASSAFMLPAATAPNAIIFGSERVTVKDMVRVGFWINVYNIILISLLSIFLIPELF